MEYLVTLFLVKMHLVILGGKKRSIAFRRQRMQIDEPAPPSEVSSYPVPQPEDPYIADLLQVADNRCARARLSWEEDLGPLCVVANLWPELLTGTQ